MYPIKMDVFINTVTVLLGLINMALGQTCQGERYDESCYIFSEVNDRQTWESAEQTCRNLGGHLAAVTSSSEQDFVSSHMRNRGIDSMWIGGQERWTKWRWTKDDEHIQKQGCFNVERSLYVDQNLPSEEITPQLCIDECAKRSYRYAAVYLTPQFYPRCLCGNQLEESWQTLKGGCAERCIKDKGTENSQYCGGIDKQSVFNVTARPVDLWYRDQPNNYDPYQECMALHNANGFKWGDEACNKKEYSLCQFNLGQTDCLTRGYQYISSPPTCYSEERLELNWFQARANCKSRENAMDLLKIGEKELFDQVYQTIKDISKRFWVGATNREWTWASGETFLFTWFADAMPSGRNKACLRIERDANPEFGWSDHSCSEIENYVCEILLRTTMTPAPTITTPTTRTTTPTTLPTTQTTTPTTLPTTQTTTPTTLPTTRQTTAQAPTTRQAPSTVQTPSPAGPPETTTRPPRTQPPPTVPPATNRPATNQAGTNPPVTQQPGSPSSTRGDGGQGGQTGTKEPGSVSSGDLALPRGVIVAISVACVAVLAALIRLIIYCIQGSRRRFMSH